MATMQEKIKMISMVSSMIFPITTKISTQARFLDMNYVDNSAQRRGRYYPSLPTSSETISHSCQGVMNK